MKKILLVAISMFALAPVAMARTTIVADTDNIQFGDTASPDVVDKEVNDVGQKEGTFESRQDRVDNAATESKEVKGVEVRD